MSYYKICGASRRQLFMVITEAVRPHYMITLTHARACSGHTGSPRAAVFITVNSLPVTRLH